MAPKKLDVAKAIENPLLRLIYRLFYATGVMDVAHAISRRLERGYFYPRQDRRRARVLAGTLEQVKQLAERGEYEGVDVVLVGQSHLDAAWLWRWVDALEKAFFTFDNALKHLEAFPTFTFSGSQAVFYHWTELYRPRTFQRIREAVASGRWELVGGDWVEADANLPCGESLVRQRLLGQRYFLEKFGRLAEVAWLPDTFGFAWTLPQILALSGAKYFWTTKLTWNRRTKFPFRTFWWVGPDGTRLLTHVSTLGLGALLSPAEHLSANRLLPTGEKLRANYASDYGQLERSFSDEPVPALGVFYGLGDGGHGPTPAEARFATGLERAGLTRMGTAGEFFGRLKALGDRLPEWADELYLEYHRGTLTTQAWIKRANRRLESALDFVEKFASFADVLGKAYPREVLRTSWRTLAFNQFHDVLPGSSIPEVYDDARRELGVVRKALAGAGREVLSYLARSVEARAPSVTSTGGGDVQIDGSAREEGSGPNAWEWAGVHPAGNEAHAVVAFNPCSWTRDDVAWLEAPRWGRWRVVDESGAPVPCQGVGRYLRGRRVLYLAFVANSVPPLGYKTFFLFPDASPADDPDAPGGSDSPFRVATDDSGNLVVSNGLVRASVDPRTGNVASLVDASTGREFVAGEFNALRAFGDEPEVEDAWNLDPGHWEKPLPVGPPLSARVSRAGPVFVEVEVVRRVGRKLKSRAVQSLRLYAGLRRVEFSTKVDWRERHVVLKVGFEAAVDARVVTCEVPHGSIDRPVAPSTPQQAARYEFCAQRWAALDDAGAGEAPGQPCGLVLVNDSKYGHSVRPGPSPGSTALFLTLLRSPRYPFDQLPASIRRFAPRPLFADQGHHLVKYSVVPHAGNWRDAHAWRAGWEFNCPLRVALVPANNPGFLPPSASFVAVDAPNVAVAAVKAAEPSIGAGSGAAAPPQLPPVEGAVWVVVRLVELEGRATKVRLGVSDLFSVTSACQTDLLELHPSPLPLLEGAGEAAAGGAPRASVLPAVEVTLRPHEIKTTCLSLRFRELNS
ncbi:MAG: hypothetical protein Kow0069_07580 [Promethearchaeota archaeon]